MKKPFTDTKAGKFLFNSFVGKTLLNTVQQVPAVGGLVTAMKESRNGSPKGDLQIGAEEIGKLIIGLVLLYGIAKGWFTIDEAEEIKDIIK